MAQPNIALVKYWGKRDRRRNLPATGSLSLTLDSLWTTMSVRLDCQLAADSLRVNGIESAALLGRVTVCLDRLLGSSRGGAKVESESNFPIAAGLASSASAFAALAMAASHAARLRSDTLTLARVAGASSGSAARSFYPGIVELSAGDEEIGLRSLAGASDWPLKVVVAVAATESKAIGSTEAMTRSAATSPFYSSWLARQDADLCIARDAVRARDFEKLAAVSEHNCLKMHSVMWTSRPPVVYWNEATLNSLETVRQLQRDGVPVFFTIDAGPQVKAVCLPDVCATVAAALSQTKGVQEVRVSGLGDGARVLEQS